MPHQKRPAGEACSGGGGRYAFIHTVEMVPQNTRALPGHWSGSLPGAHTAGSSWCMVGSARGLRFAFNISAESLSQLASHAALGRKSLA